MVRRQQKDQKPPPSVNVPKTAPSPIKKGRAKSIVKSTPEISTSTWENIVLYYLSKLKGFLQPISNTCKSACSTENDNNHPVVGPKETSVQLFRRSQVNPVRKDLKRAVKLMEPDADRYSSHCREILRRRRSTTNFSSVSRAGTSTTSIREARNTKAAKIVSAAIDYGCATGIIRNNGKYFWFKNPNRRENLTRSPSPNRRATRSPTAPRLCRLCSRASSLAAGCKRKRILSAPRQSMEVIHCSSINVQKKRKCTRAPKNKATASTSKGGKRCLRSSGKVGKTEQGRKDYNFRTVKRRKRY